jgi:MFS family permease
LIGGILYGVLADRYGRINNFKSSVFITALFSAVLLCSVNPYMMTVAYFFIGIGGGGENALGNVIFIEFCPPSKRDYLSLLGLFWGAGGCLDAGISVIVAATNNTYIYDWRYIIATDCFIKCLATAFRLYMIESPTYYLSKGEVDKALVVFNRISVENRGKEFSLTELESLRTTNESIEQEKNKNSVRELISQLFSKKHIIKAICFGFVRLYIVWLFLHLQFQCFCYLFFAFYERS